MKAMGHEGREASERVARAGTDVAQAIHCASFAIGRATVAATDIADASREFGQRLDELARNGKVLLIVLNQLATG